MEQIKKHVIETNIDPAVIHRDYRTVKCWNESTGDFTADLEIESEKPLVIGAHYNLPKKQGPVALAIKGMRTSHPTAHKPADYYLTTEDFEMVIKGERIAVL